MVGQSAQCATASGSACSALQKLQMPPSVVADHLALVRLAGEQYGEAPGERLDVDLDGAEAVDDGLGAAALSAVNTREKARLAALSLALSSARLHRRH